MLNHELISIIIPVYKVENYLDICIQSIINQTYENIEIILVDDVSPDKCPQMCDGWKERDSRIKLLHKENSGVASARDLDASKGNYIMFVDSDDKIHLKMIELVYQESKKISTDIAVVGYEEVDS